MDRWEVWTPAKVNLLLYVRGRRPDGFHLIESLVAPVSLYDRVVLELHDPTTYAPSIELQTTGIPVPLGDCNIIIRAAKGFLAALHRPMPRLRIFLEKSIPVGAGLGGGSSDAAAILWLLQEALGNPLPTNDLRALAADLGSDIPFFLHGGPAIVRGVGDEVEGVSLPRKLYLTLCSDHSVLLTTKVYERARRALTVFTSVSNIGAFLEGRISLVEALYNDLETPASALHQGIAKMKADIVTAGAVVASMTGSGSCVFGVCTSWKHAREVSARLSRQGYWAVPVQTLPKTWVLC